MLCRVNIIIKSFKEEGVVSIVDHSSVRTLLEVVVIAFNELEVVVPANILLSIEGESIPIVCNSQILLQLCVLSQVVEILSEKVDIARKFFDSLEIRSLGEVEPESN